MSRYLRNSGKRSVESGTILTILLISIITIAFSIQPVKASGTIYIRPDGSVDLPTAPIQRDGDLYTFTDDIYDSIVVERDNIVVDGAGYTLQGTGSGTGIDVTGRRNVTIKNTEIKIFDWGIFLYSSSNNSIFGNNITENNENGICLDDSSNNTVRGNNANNNYHGIFLYSSENNLISNNLVENSGYDGIFLNFADNNLISNNTCEYNGWHGIRHGIELHNSEHNLISNNTCSSNYDRGISLSHSDHNTISYNICENNYYHGIHIDYSSNNTISHNTCEHTGNGNGINLDCSSSNTISNNTCENNADHGIGLFDSSNYNTISGNNIVNNIDRGITLHESSNNKIYHNNFIGNTYQVVTHDGYMNIWDDGYPSGGNYWSDYTGVDLYLGPNQDLPGSDGIGDTPYVIEECNQDNYPFMSEYGWKKQVETTDETGERKDVFDILETVYIHGSGYSPSTRYDLYIVEDTMWVDDMNIPDRVSGTETSVTTDMNGNIPSGTVAWSGHLTPGKYDIVIDVNGNGKYDVYIDALDDEDIEVTAGFFVIPEHLLGTIGGFAACLAAYLLHPYRRKKL